MAKLNYKTSIVFVVLIYLTAIMTGCNGGLGKCTSDADCCPGFHCISIPLDGAACRSRGI